MDEKTLAEHIANPHENIKYVGLELLSQKYDPRKLVQEVEVLNATQQLKYLATVASEAAKIKGYKSASIDYLATAVKIPENPDWVHLQPNVDIRARRVIEKYPKTERETSYKVHSTLTPEELADWIDLYLNGNHLNSV